MKLFYTIIAIALLSTLTWVLNKPWGNLPALGPLLHPQTGWAAGTFSTETFLEETQWKGIKEKLTITIDDKWVPHVSASNNWDLYFAQGYLHARFRLWQMDLQTRAAAGRIAEILGEKAIKFDRAQRRKGMVLGASRSLKMIEANPESKEMLDAYTEGVNAYLLPLKPKDWPIEYKLMGFEPEAWTNLKCALMLKNMADDLTGSVNDFGLSYARQILPDSLFKLLYPMYDTASMPVIPSAKKHFSRRQDASHNYDSIFTKWTLKSADALALEDGIGSNNWVIAGSRTKSGYPILANDPHLNLSLPSIWFEIQLQSTDCNVYGVSLPGAPGVVIGFNDSIAWGLTNNYRDVKDYYHIHTIDASHYLFDGQPKPFEVVVERIKVKGQPDYLDTVRYTIHGPVEYDRTFPDPANTGYDIACTWMGHRAGNEFLTLYQLNRSHNYETFTSSLSSFFCPAQNVGYIDRKGHIAMYCPGYFVHKFPGQGRYLMEGHVSATLWPTERIPFHESPQVLDPPQQYLVAANQRTIGEEYPFWIDGPFVEIRASEINLELAAMHKTTIEEQMLLQNDYHAEIAKKLLPLLLSLNNTSITDITHQDVDSFHYTAESHWAGLFQIWWSYLQEAIWKDDLPEVPNSLYPSQERTMQLILTKLPYAFYDDKNTEAIENFSTLVKQSFQKTKDSLLRTTKGLGSTWAEIKQAELKHLSRLPAFSYEHLKVGGWGHTINAMKKNHGPSWRMLVEMRPDTIIAFGIYPGGQSGTPGSTHYTDRVEAWSNGKYHPLLFLHHAHQKNAHITQQYQIAPYAH